MESQKGITSIINQYALFATILPLMLLS